VGQIEHRQPGDVIEHEHHQFDLGASKVLITERNWFRSGLEMLVVGGVAASVAYVVGFLLQGLVP
jgi:VIT1/CCC1 family predicted Fe2+/Mn2+ transporter